MCGKKVLEFGSEFGRDFSGRRLRSRRVDGEVQWASIVDPVDCYGDTIFWGGNPHMEARVPGQHRGSEYCLEYDQNSVLTLRPVARLNWSPCGSAASIVLTPAMDGPHYFFCARVAGHPEPSPPPSPHFSEHQFGLVVIPGIGMSKVAYIAGGSINCSPDDPNYPNCPQHGGTAHSTN